jgi:hypothetical protein
MTASTACSSGPIWSVSSSMCLYLAARLVWPPDNRVKRRWLSRYSASRIVDSSYDTTGSRFVLWLHAARSALSVSG